ncbi:MAG: transglutaminase family protein [Bryobacteraceae bacterium]|jgi:transglutaminase-like putative cysteine protease
MKLRATHTTAYQYTEPVSICHTAVHLTPRDGPNQRVLDHTLSIDPMPEATFSHKDYFGNDVTCFSIHEPHRTLTISAATLIEMEPGDPLEPCLTPAWEEARGEKWRHADSHALDAYQFVFPSPRITPAAEFAAYAETSFTAGRPFLDAALDLCHRIYTEFHYDQRATTVATSVAEVLESKRGVCQDFAHFTIACLRSLGLAARYVSGYLTSGEWIGSQASHAWVSVYFPGLGWLDLDPTNDLMVSGRHVTLAWGRDYSDVAPVNGVAMGGGRQSIHVSVGVVLAAGEWV